MCCCRPPPGGLCQRRLGRPGRQTARTRCARPIRRPAARRPCAGRARPGAPGRKCWRRRRRRPPGLRCAGRAVKKRQASWPAVSSSARWRRPPWSACISGRLNSTLSKRSLRHRCEQVALARGHVARPARAALAWAGCTAVSLTSISVAVSASPWCRASGPARRCRSPAPAAGPAGGSRSSVRRMNRLPRPGRQPRGRACRARHRGGRVASAHWRSARRREGRQQLGHRRAGAAAQVVEGRGGGQLHGRISAGRAPRSPAGIGALPLSSGHRLQG